MKNKLFSVLSLAGMFTMLALFSSGCVAVVAGGAGAGGAAYAMGDLKTQMKASPQQVQSAIVGAGEALGLHSISRSGDELDGKYIFRTASDKKVTISYEVIGDGLVETQIRVGTFGDESLSLRIKDAIEQRL